MNTLEFHPESRKFELCYEMQSLTGSLSFILTLFVVFRNVYLFFLLICMRSEALRSKYD